MKKDRKIWTFIGSGALVLALLGGCVPSGSWSETPSQRPEAEAPPASEEARVAPYLNLSYHGLQTNPNHLTKTYEVVSDSDFVATVWAELNYDGWTERQGESVAMESMSLNFYGPGSTQLSIDPNDVGWIIEDTGDPYAKKYTYFDIPAGTYERIGTLLTDYTAEHFMPEISPELIDIDTESDWPISFASGEIYFVLSPEQAGEFTEDWQADAWKELEAENIVFSDKILVFNGIYSKDGRGPVDLRIDMELLLASITYEGQTNTYEITPEACQLISQKFESLRLLGQQS